MSGPELLDLFQWPALVATLVAAWLVGFPSKARRNAGFWWFVASNILWVIWAWHVQAHALIFLQVGLFILNLRGARKSEPGA